MVNWTLARAGLGGGLCLALVPACASVPAAESSESGQTGEGTSGIGSSEESSSGMGNEPPRLEAAVENLPGRVILRFSEPLAPIDDVEPSRFRLSFGKTANGRTYYADLGNVGDGYCHYDYENCTDGSCEQYPGCEFEPTFVIVESLELQAPDEVVLGFAPEWTEFHCRVVQGDPDFVLPEFDQSLLYLHYSPGDVEIQDLDGDALGAIAPDWVEMPDELFHEPGWGTLEDGPFHIPTPCDL
jgi:hypothetical protein